jgi:hypothetical protein
MQLRIPENGAVLSALRFGKRVPDVVIEMHPPATKTEVKRRTKAVLIKRPQNPKVKLQLNTKHNTQNTKHNT